MNLLLNPMLFGGITDLVEDEISLRKRVYKNSIKDALNQLHSNDLIEAITRLLESTTSNGTRQAPELVDELVGSYEVETQQFLNQEAESVDKLIAAARVSIDKGDQALKKIIDRMEGVLRNWGKVAQPLQLSFKVRGMDHEISKILAFKVRSLAVDLFNKHDNLIESNHLTQLLKELFSEVPEILERLEEDAQTLSGITTRRAETLAITPIRKLCEEVSNNAEKNPYLAHNEGQRLIVLGKSLLKTATVKSTSQVYLDARDMLAATLLHCAVAYGNESSKWEPCIHLLKEALEFANDKKLIQRLRENLAIVESNNKSLGNLDPIKSAPSLRTINGIGVTLYGKTDINPHDGSYMATYYLVFLLIPLLPLSRYRVIPRTGGYRFIGKGRLRTLDKWHIAIIVGLFFLMISNG